MNARPAPGPGQNDPTPFPGAPPPSESRGVSMDVLSLLRLFVRHWRLTAPAAALTALGLIAAVMLSSPSYEATGSVILLSPPEAPQEDPTVATAPGSTPEIGQNPFVRYGDLSVVADILARVLDSDSKRVEFEADGVTGYQVAANRLQRGPVIEVIGQGPDADAATRSAELVVTEVDNVLSDLQAAEGADPDYFIKSAPIEDSSTATAMYGSTMRAAIGALALGVLATVGLAVVAEAVTRRRPELLPAAASGDAPDAAGRPTEAGAPNGGRKGDRPALRTAVPSPRRESQGQHERGRPEATASSPGEPDQSSTSAPDRPRSALGDNGRRSARSRTDRSQ
jgi:hypothetical protein